MSANFCSAPAKNGVTSSIVRRVKLVTATRYPAEDFQLGGPWPVGLSYFRSGAPSQPTGCYVSGADRRALSSDLCGRAYIRLPASCHGSRRKGIADGMCAESAAGARAHHHCTV